MIKEGKYIIRRIIIGVGIALCLTFINSCEVHAETYPVVPNNVTFNLWTSTGAYSPSGNTDTLYENNSATNYFGFTEKVSLEGLLPDSSPNILFPGQYLIEFYVYASNSTISPNPSCGSYRSNFTNVNKTTGNWVSNEISSQCVDVYNTVYNGTSAVRMLYKFTYKGASVGADGIDEIRFNINSSPNDWFYSGYSGFHYGMSSSNIYDYDSEIISEFEKFKQNQTIISQNGVIISALDGVIQRQNQAHQDSVDTQNAIDRQTQAQQDTNNILNDSSIPSDSDSKINNIVNSTQSQNANISDLVNFIPNTLQVIINGFNNSCSGGYSLGSLFGTELVIPCINPVDYLGSFIWGVIDSILCLCYLIPLCKFLVNKYNDLTSLKNLRWQ